ncbi:hypothetical protein FRC05_011493 [Tulasnella sp. 425]|nr:hypothetical protein FRC05_011493 [Tulasnella sp. 425]
MSSGDHIGGGTTKPSSSRRADSEISRNQLSQASFYTRVEDAKREASSILQETSNWPRDSATAVKGLLETINDAPDLRDIPFEPNSMPDGLRAAIEQYASVMKDVGERLKKTYSKYGSNRKFSDVVKYPFAPLSKDGCGAALRGCRNDVDKALAAVRDHLEDKPVTRKHCRPIEKAETNRLAVEYPLTGQANESPADPARNRNHPTDADAEPTPVQQPPGNEPNLFARTPEKAISQSPSVAEAPSVDHTQSEQAIGRRRERLEIAQTTFETIEGISGAIPVVGSYIGAGCKVGLAVVKMIQVTKMLVSFTVL